MYITWNLRIYVTVHSTVSTKGIFFLSTMFTWKNVQICTVQCTYIKCHNAVQTYIYISDKNRGKVQKEQRTSNLICICTVYTKHDNELYSKCRITHLYTEHALLWRVFTIAAVQNTRIHMIDGLMDWPITTDVLYGSMFYSTRRGPLWTWRYISI